MAKKPTIQQPDNPYGLTSERAEALTGSTNFALATKLLSDLGDTLRVFQVESPEVRNSKFYAAVKMMEAIKPADGLEGMLASQMVATHSAALDCLKRAMIENQTVEGRELNLKHATKLMTIFARQMEALDKHRGKGQQSVTVKHVHVADGGQAIVGNVAVGGRAAKPNQVHEQYGSDARALGYDPGEVVDLVTPIVPARTKVKTKVNSKVKLSNSKAG